MPLAPRSAAAQSIAGMLISRPFARAPISFTCCLLSLGFEPRDALLKIFLRCAGLQVMAPFGAGILLDAGVRCKRLTVCAKGAPDRAVTAVHIGLAQRASRAELCAFCECRRTAPGLLLCFASGLELPQLRASIAVATALRRHVRSCSPRAAPHSPCFACFVQVSMSAIQRGAVGRMACRFCLENSA